MPISRQGWEIHFVRTGEQARPSKRRTVGTYQVFHDGVAQTGADMRGVIAETRGPGANRPAGNNRRVEAGTYPLFTQDGTKYVTIDFNPSESSGVLRKPGIELKETGQRREILIHPGRGFLASVGCINLAGSLPNAAEDITYTSSRRRVIAVIDDMRVFLGAEFPTRNGRRIPRAFAVIDGEP
jgi:hypothetical protein